MLLSDNQKSVPNVCCRVSGTSIQTVELSLTHGFLLNIGFLHTVYYDCRFPTPNSAKTLPTYPHIQIHTLSLSRKLCI